MEGFAGGVLPPHLGRRCSKVIDRNRLRCLDWGAGQGRNTQAYHLSCFPG
jgi:hypothetical protein